LWPLLWNWRATLRRVAYALGLAATAVVSGAIVHGCGVQKRNHELDEHVREMADKDRQIQAVKNTKVSIEQALLKANTDLATLIAQSQTRPSTQLREIVTIETTVPGEVVVVPGDCSLPDHTFELSNGLEVARATYSEEVTYETFEQRFRGTLVIGEKRSAVSLEQSTSADPNHWEELEVDLKVQAVEERKRPIFMPHVSLGATVDIVIGGEVTVEPVVSLAVPLIHPHENLDLLAPAIRFNQNTVRIGADVAAYNVGAHMSPVFSDLWVTVGLDYGPIKNDYGVGVGLSSKF